jgi:hypothetical protein
MDGFDEKIQMQPPYNLYFQLRASACPPILRLVRSLHDLQLYCPFSLQPGDAPIAFSLR